MIRDGEWNRYTDIDLADISGTTDTQNEIDDARWFIEEKLEDDAPGEQGSKDFWGVGMDGDNIEIRSKHLTEKELPKVEKAQPIGVEDMAGGGFHEVEFDEKYVMEKYCRPKDVERERLGWEAREKALMQVER